MRFNKVLISLLLGSASLAQAANFSTFLGDTRTYRATKVLGDAAGNTYVAGTRRIPGTELNNCFVTKLDSTGAEVFTAVYRTGGRFDAVKALAVDTAGNIFLGGSTDSTAIDRVGALQTTRGLGSTGFLAKLSPDGARVLWGTYFGGQRGPAEINAIALDRDQNIYVTGETSASDFAVTAGLPSSNRLGISPPNVVSGTLVAKIAAAGNQVVWSGVVAGTAVSCGAGSSCFLSARRTEGVAIGLDGDGNVYFAGNSNTTDLPTTQRAMAREGIGAFVGKVNAAGTALEYLTYLGATNYIVTPSSTPANQVAAMAVDLAGNTYLTGWTADPRFPASRGAYQTAFGGTFVDDRRPAPDGDAFVAKLRPDGSGLSWATYAGGPGEEAAIGIGLATNGEIWIAGRTASAGFPDASNSGGDFVAAFDAQGTRLLRSTRYFSATVAGTVSLTARPLIHAVGANGMVSSFESGPISGPSVWGVANAAVGMPQNVVAGGEVVSIYGVGLGGSNAVSFDGMAAPLLYVSPSQVNAVVPLGVRGRDSVRMRVSGGGNPVEMPVYLAANLPAIFQQADGTAAAINEDGTVNSAANPAKKGSVVAMWVTGVWGSAAGTDGAVSPGAADHGCCGVIVGEFTTARAEVLYGGAAPGLVVGVSQVNFRIPPDFPGGPLTVVRLTAGGETSVPARLHLAE